MPITAKVPFEIAEVSPQPAKTLTDIWLSRIVLDMLSPTQGEARIETNYYDPATGEVADETAGHLFVPDLPLAIQEVPEAAAAVEAIVAAFPAIRDWQLATAEARIKAEADAAKLESEKLKAEDEAEAAALADAAKQGA
tara:strand:- start:33555 stop:33971 length:417 start_codon:yes stop_codon:yes gene_type:complete